MDISRKRMLVLIALASLGAAPLLALTGPAGSARAGDKAADKKAEEGTALVLPRDPRAVVLSYDPGANGFIRKGPPPHLRIQADGQLTVTNVFDGSKKTSQLTMRQLEELLLFVIKDNDFFTLSEAKIADAIKTEAGKGPFLAIGGAGTSVITVQVNGKQHEVSYRGADAFLRAYPKAAPLARFVAIEKRLSDLAQTTAKAK